MCSPHRGRRPTRPDATNPVCPVGSGNANLALSDKTGLNSKQKYGATFQKVFFTVKSFT